MKKVTFLLATLLIGSMMLTGCKKDTPNNGDNEGGGGNTPTTEKVYSVKYELLETAKVEGVMVSVLPGCKFNVSYVDADGKTVEVQQVTAPWSVMIENVKTPFTAKMEGTITYDESQIPETDIVFTKLPKITFIGNGDPIIEENFKVHKWNTKQKFLEAVQQNPRLLQFEVSKAF